MRREEEGIRDHLHGVYFSRLLLSFGLEGGVQVWSARALDLRLLLAQKFGLSYYLYEQAQQLELRLLIWPRRYAWTENNTKRGKYRDFNAPRNKRITDKACRALNQRKLPAILFWSMAGAKDVWNYEHCVAKGCLLQFTRPLSVKGAESTVYPATKCVLKGTDKIEHINKIRTWIEAGEDRRWPDVGCDILNLLRWDEPMMSFPHYNTYYKK